MANSDIYLDFLSEIVDVCSKLEASLTQGQNDLATERRSPQEVANDLRGDLKDVKAIRDTAKTLLGQRRIDLKAEKKMDFKDANQFTKFWDKFKRKG